MNDKAKEIVTQCVQTLTKSREERPGFDVAIIEYETCYLAFVDHLYPTGFIMDCMWDLVGFWKMERPLACLFHDRILIFTTEKRSKSDTHDLELTSALKLETIFQPGAAIGRRMLQTRVDDLCNIEKKTYLTKLTELSSHVITEADGVSLDLRELLSIECQYGYQVFFNSS